MYPCSKLSSAGFNRKGFGYFFRLQQGLQYLLKIISDYETFSVFLLNFN